MRFSLKLSLEAHVEPALQFLNVEKRFLMLAETCTLEISFHSCLESLCVKGRFLAVFLDFSLKRGVLQRTVICLIVFVLL